MMKTIFKEISLWSDENMNEKSCWMLAELYQVVKLHFEAKFNIKASRIIENFEGIAISSKIRWQKWCFFQDIVTPSREKDIVEDWERPFNACITLFKLILEFRIFDIINIMLYKDRIEKVMHKPFEHLL